MAMLGPWTNAQVIVNSVDLSDHVSSVQIQSKVDTQEVTAMGATGKAYMPGLSDESIKVKFRQDFAAAAVDATIGNLYFSKATFPVEIRPVKAARSATNPAYVAQQCFVSDYPALSGDVGSTLDVEVTFTVSGQTSGIQRLTS